jgi:hypothetical protein
MQALEKGQYFGLFKSLDEIRFAGVGLKKWLASKLKQLRCCK